MTNAALQAIIAESGTKVNMIVLDNNVKLFFGYDFCPKIDDHFMNVNDIKFETKSGVDFFKVYTPSLRESDRESGINAYMWYPTALIQGICIMEDSAGKYLLDPFRFG